MQGTFPDIVLIVQNLFLQKRYTRIALTDARRFILPKQHQSWVRKETKPNFTSGQPVFVALSAAGTTESQKHLEQTFPAGKYLQRITHKQLKSQTGWPIILPERMSFLTSARMPFSRWTQVFCPLQWAGLEGPRSLWWLKAGMSQPPHSPAHGHLVVGVQGSGFPLDQLSQELQERQKSHLEQAQLLCSQLTQV